MADRLKSLTLPKLEAGRSRMTIFRNALKLRASGLSRRASVAHAVKHSGRLRLTPPVPPKPTLSTDSLPALATPDLPGTTTPFDEN